MEEGAEEAGGGTASMAARRRTRDESRLGTGASGSLGWALAWQELGWPSSAEGSIFFKHYFPDK